MGDKETLSKARKELEELYLGIPDESVNLTFQDLAQVRNAEMKETSPPQTVSEKKTPSSNLAKLPSLDFNRGLESASFQNLNIRNNHYNMPQFHNHRHHAHTNADSHHSHVFDHHGHDAGDNHHLQRSIVYDDMSHGSGMSMSMAYGIERRGGRRRPGIPHSNICTACSNYIYICRHRCLVCGRVYCRQCVSIGMGEMTEGRKCTECLGRRFSQRCKHT